MRYVLVVVGVAALSAATLASWPSPRPGGVLEPIELMALMAPRQMVAGERYVIYAGLDNLPPDAKARVQLCREGACVFDRLTALEQQRTWWGWLGAVRLESGRYQGHLFIQLPHPTTTLRTVAHFSWDVDVKE